MSDARAILDALPKPVALVDASLHVVEANRTFLARFGGSPAAGPGGLWQALEATVARMQPASLRGQFRWEGGSPEPLPWDVHVTRLDDGRYLVHADDVSGSVAMESILGGVRGYVERVLNHIDRAVVGVDASMRVTFFNEAQADLWRRGGRIAALDCVGEPLAKVYPVFDAERWRAIGDGLGRHQALRRERVTWAAAGGVRLEISVLPLDAPGEAPTGAVCVTEVLDPS